MNCCFTGHRLVKSTRNMEYTIKKELKALIGVGVTDFYSGGTYGWDAMCELAVLRLRKKYPHIRLHIILPCSPKEHTAEWDGRQREVCYKIMNSADSVEFVTEKYFDGCVKMRNMRLIEAADSCFCYYNEKNIGSSTAQTVQMAVKKGIDVINIYSPANDGGDF